MKRLIVRVASIIAVPILLVSLNGCGILRCTLCSNGEASASAQANITHMGNTIEPLIITATGFGAPDNQNQNKPQQTLMAMRASEVDAYRTLAERVQGVQISASTKVADFVTNYDHLRAVVDSYIQQSRIISQGLTNQGYYETTLSLTLGQDFFQNFTAASSVKGAPTTKAHNPALERRISTLSTTDSHYDTGNGQRQVWPE